MNVAFVTHDGVLKHPKFDHILSGCTSLRLLELARGLEGKLRGVEVCDVPVAEARGAREMLLIGSSIKVAPSPSGTASPSETAHRARSPGPSSTCSRRTCARRATGCSTSPTETAAPPL